MAARRGFAVMDPEEVAKLGSRGGKIAHRRGKAHEFARGAEAERAGRKGGLASQKRRRERLEQEKKETPS